MTAIAPSKFCFSALGLPTYEEGNITRRPGLTSRSFSLLTTCWCNASYCSLLSLFWLFLVKARRCPSILTYASTTYW